jgi:hypothetical protein
MTNHLFIAVYGYVYAYFNSSGLHFIFHSRLAYVLFSVAHFSVLLCQGWFFDESGAGRSAQCAGV